MLNVFVPQKRMSDLHGIFGRRCQLGGYMTLPSRGSGPGCIAPCLVVSGAQSMDSRMKADQREPRTSSSSNVAPTFFRITTWLVYLRTRGSLHMKIVEFDDFQLKLGFHTPKRDHFGINFCFSGQR